MPRPVQQPSYNNGGRGREEKEPRRTFNNNVGPSCWKLPLLVLEGSSGILLSGLFTRAAFGMCDRVSYIGNKEQ